MTISKHILNEMKYKIINPFSNSIKLRYVLLLEFCLIMYIIPPIPVFYSVYVKSIACQYKLYLSEKKNLIKFNRFMSTMN